MSDTKQSELIRNEKGQIVGGKPPAGFNVHPENRHNGAWKKEDTARFKLEQIMKMSKLQLTEYITKEETPVFEQRMAECVQDGRWKDLEGMINQVYGKPQESVDLTTQGKSLNPYSELTTDELRKLAGK